MADMSSFWSPPLQLIGDERLGGSRLILSISVGIPSEPGTHETVEVLDVGLDRRGRSITRPQAQFETPLQFLDVIDRQHGSRLHTGIAIRCRNSVRGTLLPCPRQWALSDSNRRPAGCKPAALTN